MVGIKDLPSNIEIITDGEFYTWRYKDTINGLPSPVSFKTKTKDEAIEDAIRFEKWLISEKGRLKPVKE